MARPEKPCTDFPLFPHANGHWAKKVLGRLHYFGRWDEDSKGKKALAKWNSEKDDLLAGRTPRQQRAARLSVKGLCDRFMTAKAHQRDAGDITPRTWQDYHATCTRIVAEFDKHRLVEDLAADDFESLRASLAKNANPTTLGNEVGRIRVVFKYAYDAGLIDRPVRFGPTFKKPSKRVLRKERQKKGERMFEPEDLKKILKSTDGQLKAMILLGLNCGFGNTDCGTLPLSAVDLDGGWIDFPRPKTAVERRCPLWPETVQALREAIEQRPTPKDPANSQLLFVTKYGGPWTTQATFNPITKEFRKVLDATGTYRPGRSFYTLRHVFETIAGECRDQVAVNAIMGHVDGTMAGNYRQRISDDRLRDAVEVVRKWLAPALRRRGAKK
ncbi:tyrosine-type recombinase/integrase [Aeoliella sp.]|uniref:tyrosine-type recombinase/integrase n=1 Tax=Aeoliella sp. TaxID=2795800 RepID=UPI003CCBDDD3